MPILDQGDLGSCTGNAGTACMGRGTFYGTLSGSPRYTLDEIGAVALYSRATALDSYGGTYPPDDTGSDGLSVAKALKEGGEISGYLWAFTPDAALGALMDTPLITGVPWYNSMFDPDPSTGEVKLDRSSGLAGGHELCVDGYQTDGHRVWFSNSWGSSWGIGGRAWWSFETWSALLAEDGDVTQFVPVTAPAPQPTPAPDDADAALWGATQHWRTERHVGDNAKAAAALKAWGKARGFA